MTDDTFCIEDPLGTYDSGQVLRYHANTQMNRRLQTNADHQWGVAVICLSIAPELCDRNLLIHALLHDRGERLAGDLPANVKRQFPAISVSHKQAEAEFAERFAKNLPEITEQQKILLKISDICEALFCILMYAPKPEEVEGWIGTISSLSENVGKFDERCPIDRAWLFVDTFLNPLIRKRQDQIGSNLIPTATPF